MADQFGNRMKKYEAVSDIRLTERIPIIVRLDGNSFSKFTKQMKFEKPFDQRFSNAMWEATKAVLEYTSGGMCGYTQSDEITLLLRNDMSEKTEPFLDNRLEKICSLLASTASVKFSSTISQSIGKPVEAVFDCRVFLVPEKEVNNAFLWRQNDAWKNCVSGVAWYGLKEKYGRKTAMKMLHGKSTNERQELIFQELGINMNDYPTKFKRGVIIKREPVETSVEDLIGEEKAKELGKSGEIVIRKPWIVDEEIPKFTNTEYIGQFLK